jgi:hypothetical protein
MKEGIIMSKGMGMREQCETKAEYFPHTCRTRALMDIFTYIYIGMITTNAPE